MMVVVLMYGIMQIMIMIFMMVVVMFYMHMMVIVVILMVLLFVNVAFITVIISTMLTVVDMPIMVVSGIVSMDVSWAIFIVMRTSSMMLEVFIPVSVHLVSVSVMSLMDRSKVVITMSWEVIYNFFMTLF